MRILIAMSGGLDSSMVAALLKEQGHDLVGVTMKVWYANQHENSYNYFEDEIIDAKNIAKKFDFPHYVIDLEEDFYNIVVQNFENEYLAGRTPNPCVVCNRQIKFGKLIEVMKELDCERIATGHYAKIAHENGRYFLQQGIDELKDQTYFMWNISQESLSKMMFPLGEFSKAEIRKMATEKGMLKVAEKRESYDICFLPKMNYRDFLNQRNMAEEGNFVLEDATIIGKHKGFSMYTIGQRKGLDIGYKFPLYVLKINSEKNEVVLAAKVKLMSNFIQLRDLNLQKYSEIIDGMEVNVKIRLRNNPVKGILRKENNEYTITLDEEIFAIAPGQSAVFYEENDLVGGGFIV